MWAACHKLLARACSRGGKALTPQAALPAPGVAANFAFVIACAFGGQGTPGFGEAVRKCLSTAVKFT